MNKRAKMYIRMYEFDFIYRTFSGILNLNFHLTAILPAFHSLRIKKSFLHPIDYSIIFTEKGRFLKPRQITDKGIQLPQPPPDIAWLDAVLQFRIGKDAAADPTQISGKSDIPVQSTLRSFDRSLFLKRGQRVCSLPCFWSKD